MDALWGPSGHTLTHVYTKYQQYFENDLLLVQKTILISRARSGEDEASRCSRGGEILTPDVPVATAFTRLSTAHNQLIWRLACVPAGRWCVRDQTHWMMTGQGTA